MIPKVLKLPTWLVVLLLIPYIFLFPRTATRDDIKVIGVIDGDTLVLDGKVRLRLRHLDAPELEFCGGEEAKQLLTELVDGKSIRIDEKILDQRGRPMALVYVGSNLINQTMLESGWARYHSDQTSQTKDIQSTADTAKKARLGIFGPQCYQKENPDKPQCNIKANIDKSTKVRKYYLPNCAQYQFTIVEKDIGEDWFCSEPEAQAAGFAKAATCK
ncbi:MAG: thermonuclease family protein [Candidatus Beckwithbacteria bacterium]|nr:thermonuclease family protein [Candidatus Beckwithbacteria bacterium]